MQLVKATDFNDFTEAFVSGVANIEEIAPGVVRVSYFIDKEDTHEGDRERKIVGSQIWSLPRLVDNLLVMQKVLKEMRPRGAAETGAGGRHALSEAAAPSLRWRRRGAGLACWGDRRR